jgi:hypothetical protein
LPYFEKINIFFNITKKVLAKLITYPGAVYFSTKKNRNVKEPLVSSHTIPVGYALSHMRRMPAARQKVLIGVGRFGV